MTCIISYKDYAERQTLLAADSQATTGWTRHILPSTELVGKLCTKKDVEEQDTYIFGISGHPRVAQLIRYELQIPRRSQQTSLDAHVIIVSTAIRNLLRTAGYAEIASNHESQDSHILLATGTRVFTIETNYQVCEDSTNYTAIGCGASYAKGALSAMQFETLLPNIMLDRALNIACLHSIGCCAPYTYAQLPWPEDTNG